MKKKISSIEYSEKLIKSLAFVPAALLVLFHVFMVYYVFPFNEDGAMRIEVSSRAGTSVNYLTVEEFILISTIAIAVALASAILILAGLHYKKINLALTTYLLFVTATGIYLSIYLANALYVLWDAWWASALGIIVSLAISTALLVAVFVPLKSTKK